MRREAINTPVLIMTARDTVDERVLGLDCGADDYVVKPVELKELRSRVRALSRRSHGFAAPEIELGELRINTASQQVWWRGVEVELNRREFVVLCEFVNKPGQVLARGQLEEALYGWGEGVESNALEVHIHHLRRKLDRKLIKTVRGIGYRLEANHAGKPLIAPASNLVRGGHTAYLDQLVRNRHIHGNDQGGRRNIQRLAGADGSYH